LTEAGEVALSYARRILALNDEFIEDASLGMSVHFGRYTVHPAKIAISFHIDIDRAPSPNWDYTTQVRTYEISS
jgi:hypothetical protein